MGRRSGRRRGSGSLYTMDEDGIYTTVRADNMLGEDAELLHEALYALPYWLQEAKTLQEIASGRGREALRLSKLLGALNDELTASEERADATEAREQRLKEAVQAISDEYCQWRDKGRAANVMFNLASGTLSTLYPDTPAPKEDDNQ